MKSSEANILMKNDLEEGGLERERGGRKRRGKDPNILYFYHCLAIFLSVYLSAYFPYTYSCRPTTQQQEVHQLLNRSVHGPTAADIIASPSLP